MSVHRYALETQFKLVCSSWVDADMPLYYTYSFEVPGAGSALSPLADQQLQPSYDAMLPLGSPSFNDSLIVWSKISDSYGASAELDEAVSVTQFDYGSQTSRRRRLFPAAAHVSEHLLVPEEREAVRAGARRLLGTGWSLTAYLSNKTESLVTEALDASDPNTCMQAVSGVAAILNANNAIDGSDVAAREQLRGSMINMHLTACVSIMELTATTVNQRASLLASIASDGTELNLGAQLNALSSIRTLVEAVDTDGGGIDDDAASGVGRLEICPTIVTFTHAACERTTCFLPSRFCVLFRAAFSLLFSSHIVLSLVVVMMTPSPTTTSMGSDADC